MDVVPAFFDRFAKIGTPLFSMPDGAGGWMQTSPQRHNRYIKEANEASGGKVKRTAQILKFWRECRKPRVPISSFHIEMVLASTQICCGAKSYPQCVAELLRVLDERQCRALIDPLGISGYIPAVKTERQRDTAHASIRDSRYHADAALEAEADGDLDESRRQWSIVFNHQNPWLLR